MTTDQTPPNDTQTPDTSREVVEAALKRAQITSGMLKMGERIAWGSDSGAIDALSELCAALLAERDLSAAREAAAWISGRDAAVKLNDQQIRDYVLEHGTYDGSTGITEFPGDGEEWVGDREELSDTIRDLAPPTDPAAAIDRLVAERVQEAFETLAAEIEAEEREAATWGGPDPRGPHEAQINLRFARMLRARANKEVQS